MRPRDILAINLRTQMAARPDLGTLPKVTARSGVSNGTLDRIRRAIASVRVDELDKLGIAFGVEPWELLRPHDHSALSPLALRLGEHLDRTAHDEAGHKAGYVAAMAVIDALATTPGSPEMPAPDHEANRAPAPVREKRGD